jgi:hypothetical protein
MEKKMPLKYLLFLTLSLALVVAEVGVIKGA